MITSETITDEEIGSLQAEAYETFFVACNALVPADYWDARVREMRSLARARCVEILNARGVK